MKKRPQDLDKMQQKLMNLFADIETDKSFNVLLLHQYLDGDKNVSSSMSYTGSLSSIHSNIISIAFHAMQMYSQNKRIVIGIWAAMFKAQLIIAKDIISKELHDNLVNALGLFEEDLIDIVDLISENVAESGELLELAKYNSFINDFLERIKAKE